MLCLLVIVIPSAASGQETEPISGGLVPVVDLEPYVLVHVDGMEVRLSVAAVGGESCSWDFGDGESGEGNPAHHRYERVGGYSVDARCGDLELQSALTVERPPSHGAFPLTFVGIGGLLLALVVGAVLLRARRVAGGGRDDRHAGFGSAESVDGDRSPRKRRSWLWVVGASILVLGILIGLDLVSARDRTVKAEADLRRAVELLESGDVEGARELLVVSTDSLTAAHRRLRSPWLGIVRVMPLAGTELRAATAGVRAARETSLAALDLLNWVVEDHSPLFDEGRIGARGLEELQAAVERAAAHLTVGVEVLAAAPAPRTRLVGSRFDEVREGASRLLGVLDGLGWLLGRLDASVDGDQPFLVLLLLENGAEQRATGGLLGFVVLAEIRDGRVEIREATGVTSLVRIGPGGYVEVDAPADYVRRYGTFLANTTLWANANLSPDFPTVAGVVRDLYSVSTGLKVDAIARIDLVGLGYLLDVFPAISVGDLTAGDAQLATQFLIDSYRRYPDPIEQNTYLASVVSDVVGQILEVGGADRPALISAVRAVVAERRLAVAIDEPRASAALDLVGADGSIPSGDPGELGVVFQNFAGNKIDLFTEATIEVDLQPSGCLMTGEITLTLKNATPDGFDFLPSLEADNAGRWWVSFYLPREAAVLDLLVDGAQSGGSFDRELGLPVVSVLATAPRGASVSTTLRWQEDVEEAGYTVTLEPQPLVNPATVAIDGASPVPLVERFRHEAPVSCST